MAGIPTSALASLLVAVTPRGDEDAAATGNHQTHTTLRESARSCAERKARVLFKHRPAVIRWTAAGASSTPRQQQQDCTAGGSTTVAVAPPTARSDDSPQTVVAGEQRNGSRIQSDLVSPLLSLVHTESMGRHVVAQDGPLQAGTLLLRETPFAWSLHPEFSGEFCAHCLCEMTSSTILCPGCELVAYCSTTCATEALRMWHGRECLDPSSGAPLEPAMSSMSPACRVALRAFRRARQQEEPPPSEGERKDERFVKGSPACTATAVSATNTTTTAAPAAVAEARSTTCTVGSRSISPTSGDDFVVAWPTVKLSHLQEHYIARSPRERDLLGTEAAVAAVLSLASGGGKVGVQEDSNGSSGNGGGAKPAGQDGCKLLASELVTTLFKVSTNAFAVSSLRCSEPSVGRHVRPLSHTKVAVGLYLAAAMFNHCCSPNALVTFRGREMRVVATRTIEKGEPVTISYGPLASKVPSTSERQAYLRNAYFFRCECAACCPSAAAVSTVRPPHNPGDDVEGNNKQGVALVDGSRARADAVASSKRTEFACTLNIGSSCCPGTLLVGVPPPLPSPPPPPTTTTPMHAKFCDIEKDVGARRGKTEVGLWCDSCGGRVPPGSADTLLGEDVEDRRLWDEAMAAVSRLEEKEQEAEVGGGSGSSKPPPPPPSPSPRPPQKLAVSPSTYYNTPEGDGSALAAASHSLSDPSPSGDTVGSGTASSFALSLVVECIKWRDARLCRASMRRAIAHDMHARILAMQEDFAGAADACARAVHVLVKIFSPGDQELGVEFLKLAELCFNAGWMDKCGAACRKARVSLGVCLQPGDEQLVVLDTLQEICASACPRGRV